MPSEHRPVELMTEAVQVALIVGMPATIVALGGVAIGWRNGTKAPGVDLKGVVADVDGE